MKIDLSCPVELWRYDLPTQDYPVCTLTLFNLAEKSVASIQASFVCYDRAGDEFARHVERVQGLNGPPKQTFDMSVAVEEGVYAADMEFIIEKTWFEDGTVWRRGANSFSEYTPNTLPNNRQLEMLRYIAGEDAVGYPSDQGALWLCICGRANKASADMCCRCGRDKNAMFTHLTQTAVTQSIHEKEEALEAKALHARESASRMEQARQQRRTRRRRRRRIILAVGITLVVLTAGTYGVYHHGLPYYHYWKACQTLNEGAFEQARTQFDTMPDYRDSASLALECDYRYAMSLMQPPTWARLAEARDILDALAKETLPLPNGEGGDGIAQSDGYRDSADLALSTRYQMAEMKLNELRYEEAITLFKEISTWRDAKARIKEANYRWAVSLQEAGDYKAARDLYVELSDYEDCEARALQCLYDMAGQSADQADYESAVRRYTKAGDYLDSATRVKECQYLWGNQLFAKKSFDAAAEHFLLAGTYKDAALLAAQCLYEPAKIKMDEGQYAEAAAMFEKISGHEDAALLAKQCYYTLGERALTAGDYTQALTLLTAAGDYEDAAILCSECVYRPAKAAMTAGEYEQARELLLTIPGYLDAAQLEQKARYQQGIQLMNAKKYAEAAELFAVLASEGFAESGDRLTEARYAYGVGLLDGMQYEQAVQVFTEMPGYQKSNTYLQQARYGLASQYMANQQYTEAEAQLQKVGGYSDADDLISECRYQRALIAQQAGDSETAGKLFEALGTYKDAKAQFQNVTYDRALALREAGDYLAAGDAFALLGAFSDAAAQSKACYEALYGDVYAAANAAMEANDYAQVVQLLSEIELQKLPSAYASLSETYQEANYLMGNELYSAGKPYEALKYYENIPDYKNVSDYLTRAAYLILGNWTGTNDDALRAEFRADGTCSIDGRDSFFDLANQYALRTGDTQGDLRITHAIVYLNTRSLTLQNSSTGKFLRFTRAADE